MRAVLKAATLIAVANATWVPYVLAQDQTPSEGAREGSASDDMLFLLEEPESESTAASPSPQAGTAYAQEGSDPAQASDSGDGSAAPAASSPSTDGATAAAPADPALEVIPVPQPESPIPTAATPSPRRGVLEEIVVTAQRREESAQDVPISITVFSQEDIGNANIVNSSDLAIYTPSLSTNERFGSETATFAIRGFTQDLRTTASVATYFAEVVAPRGQTSQTSGDGAGPGTLFDLENVQVLKGPQGTLFGRNTTGGAILIVPRKPQDEFGGYVEVTNGNFATRRVQAVMNVPITEGFKIRAGVDDNRRDGYLDNVTDIGADRLANINYTAFRLSGLLDVTDSVENYTILTYVDSETHGFTRQLFACNPDRSPRNPFFAFTSEPCQRQLAGQAARGQNGFFDVVSTVPEPYSLIKEKRLINTLTWDINDDVRLKNILAYAHLHTENESDVYGSQFDSTVDPDPRREFEIGVSIASSIPVTSQETYVAELQLQGQAQEGRLQWQTGVYHEESKPDGFSGNVAPILISCELASIKLGPSRYNCFDPTNGVLGSVLDQYYKVNYTNQAVYAETTYDIIEQLSVTLGLRYTWDETEGYGIKRRYTFAGSAPLPVIETITSPKVKTDAPTGQIQFSYKPLPDVMAYAKYVRGYRQGSVVLASDRGIDTYDAEKVDTYEVGAKTSFDWVIPGRFNFAVFYNDFTDQQLQVGYLSPSSGPTTSIFNAGKSRIQGAEVEAFLQLRDDLRMSLSYAFLDTKLLENEDRRAQVQAAGGPIAGATYAPSADVGDELPYAADHSFVVGLTYTLPLASEIGTVDIGSTYVYTGEQRAAATSTGPFSMLDPYELLNANLNWTDVYGMPLDFGLFATNVLEEEYVTSVGGSYRSTGVETRGVGMPRMFGARLRYRFGG